MSNFATCYAEALKKTAAKKAEYEKMYKNVVTDKFMNQLLDKETKKLPGILAREYLDFLCEAVETCEGLTEEDFDDYRDEISLYQRYYDCLDHNGKPKRTPDIEWSELPDEALLSFVDYDM